MLRRDARTIAALTRMLQHEHTLRAEFASLRLQDAARADRLQKELDDAEACIAELVNRRAEIAGCLEEVVAFMPPAGPEASEAWDRAFALLDDFRRESE